MLVKGVHNMKATSYLTAVNMTFISWSFKHDKLLNYTQKNQRDDVPPQSPEDDDNTHGWKWSIKTQGCVTKLYEWVHVCISLNGGSMETIIKKLKTTRMTLRQTYNSKPFKQNKSLTDKLKRLRLLPRSSIPTFLINQEQTSWINPIIYS